MSIGSVKEWVKDKNIVLDRNKSVRLSSRDIISSCQCHVSSVRFFTKSIAGTVDLIIPCKYFLYNECNQTTEVKKL